MFVSLFTLSVREGENNIGKIRTGNVRDMNNCTRCSAFWGRTCLRVGWEVPFLRTIFHGCFFIREYGNIMDWFGLIDATPMANAVIPFHKNIQSLNCYQLEYSKT